MKNLNKFLYYINVCLFLFPKLTISLQKDIINDINVFTQDLVTIFKDKNKLSTRAQKKQFILDTVTDLFKCILIDKILIEVESNKEISELFNLKNKEYIKKYNFEGDPFNNKIEDNEIIEETVGDDNSISNNSITNNYNLNDYQKIDTPLAPIDNEINKINNNLINEILNIKNKFDDNNKLYNEMQNKVQSIKNNIHGEFKQKILDDITELMRIQLENKMKLISKVIEDNILKIVKLYDNRTFEIEKQVKNIIEERLVDIINNFNYKIECNANNELTLTNSQTGVITTCKLGIKNIIGPKGPPGEKGDTPLLKEMKITPDNKLSITVDDGIKKYDVISNNTIPAGPSGLKGDKGDRGEKGDIGLPGRSIIDLKWDQENVMNIDYENNKNLIINRSLSVGHGSHCLHNNSLAIGNAYCFKQYSMALGKNSKVMGTNSIGLFGSCTSDNSMAIFSNNTEENSVLIGNNKDLNLQKVSINAKLIDLNCHELRMKCNILDNKVIENMSHDIEILKNKVLTLEKKIAI